MCAFATVPTHVEVREQFVGVRCPWFGTWLIRLGSKRLYPLSQPSFCSRTHARTILRGCQSAAQEPVPWALALVPALLPRRPWLVFPVPVPSGAGVWLQQPGTQSQGSRRKSVVKGAAPAAAGLGSWPGGAGASRLLVKCRHPAGLPTYSQGNSDPLGALPTALKPAC